VSILLRNRPTRLGAEELIELGRPLPLAIAARQPFFLGREPRPASGIGQLEFLGNVFGWIADGLAFLFTKMADLIDIPLKIISQGVDLVFNGAADLLRNIPILGDFLAEILVLGGAVIKFALTIPGLVLREVGNLLSGVGQALKSKNSDSENQEKVEGAKENILSKAPSELKENVKALLNASGITGKNLTPGVASSGQVTATPEPAGTAAAIPAGGETDLGTILGIGVPAIGLIVLVAVLS
jgi:hypothetical protein